MSSSSHLELVGKIIEEFIEEIRAGKTPEVESYVNRDPQIATQVREALSAVLMIEGIDHPASIQPKQPAADASSRRPTPDQIGEFKIIRELGRGGMGRVYEAVQNSLDRRVALKVLDAKDDLDSQYSARFEVEAHAAASLHHTNIVPVFQVGKSDGHYFYAMQLIEGNSLEKVIRRLSKNGRYDTSLNQLIPTENYPGITQVTDHTTDYSSKTPNSDTSRSVNAVTEKPTEAVCDSIDQAAAEGDSILDNGTPVFFKKIAEMGRAAAEALSYAHEKGVLHRDVKPANLILDRQANVWLTDFGLAKYRDHDLTQTGQIVGTLRYLAPERLVGIGDHRADIYSLGLTLYELVTLQPAFSDSDQATLIGKINRESIVDPIKRCPDIPPDLNAIIKKAIHREPELRYQSAEALAEDLRRFTEDRPILSRSISSYRKVLLWSRRNPVVAALLSTVFLLMILLTAGAIFSSLSLDEKNREISRRFENEKKLRAESDQRLLDASLNAFDALSVSVDPGRQSNMKKQISVIQELNKSQEEISVDKRIIRNMYIKALTRFDIVESLRVSLEDELITPDNDWGFSSDLSKLARISNIGQFEVCSVEDQQVLATLGSNWKYAKTSFSPDDRLVCIYGVHDDLSARFEIFDWKSGNRILAHNASTHEGLKGSFAFSANNRRVAFRDETYIHVFDLVNREMVRKLKTLGTPWLALSPSGDHLIFARFDGIALYDIQQDTIVDTFKGVPSSTMGCWSPFPNYFAAGTGTGSIAIWEIGNSDSPMRMLHGHSSEIESLAFHPDGTMLVSSSRAGSTRIWKRGYVELVTQKGGKQFDKSGTKIAFFDDEVAFGIWEIAGCSPREFSISPIPAQEGSFSIGLSSTKVAWASRGKHLPILDLNPFQLRLIPTPVGNDDTVVMQFEPESPSANPSLMFAADRTLFKAHCPSDEKGQSEWRVENLYQYESWGQRLFPIDNDSIVLLDQQNGFQYKHGNDVVDVKTDWWCAAATAFKNHLVVTSKSAAEYVVFPLDEFKAGNSAGARLIKLDVDQAAVPVAGPGNKIAFSSNSTILVYNIEHDFEPKLDTRIDIADSDAFCRIAFANDGSILAVTSYKEILLYRTSDWSLLAKLPAPANTVFAGTVLENSIDIKFSDDDRYLIHGTTSGSLIVWDFKRIRDELNLQHLGIDAPKS